MTANALAIPPNATGQVNNARQLVVVPDREGGVLNIDHVGARQTRLPTESSVNAFPHQVDATGPEEHAHQSSLIDTTNVRLADDADFGAGSASPLVDAANRSALADLRAQLDATGDFEIATGAITDTPEGKRPETVSARALLDELEDQEDLAEVISACTLSQARLRGAQSTTGGRRDA